jgi:hypothetical protein
MGVHTHKAYVDTQMVCHLLSQCVSGHHVRHASLLLRTRTATTQGHRGILLPLRANREPSTHPTTTTGALKLEPDLSQA